LRHLAGRLVLQAAGLGVELVLALVRLGRGPVGRAVVLVELLRVEGNDLEAVVAGLDALQDGIGKETFRLLPVVLVEDVLSFVTSRLRGEQHHDGQRECETTRLQYARFPPVAIEDRLNGRGQRLSTAPVGSRGSMGWGLASATSLSYSHSRTEPTRTIFGF